MKIGVDGGGTKTECILIDDTGTIVARYIGPGCNPSLVGPEKAKEILCSALQALLSSAPRPTTPGAPPSLAGTPLTVLRTLLCMAGSPAFWQRTAATLDGHGAVTAATDALPVLELATGGAPGLVLHAGTGSFVAARAPDGTVHFFAGYGWRLGDPGSAHDIGRRGIQRALGELQGCATATGLGAALTEEFGSSAPGEITAALYQDPLANRRIVAFASRVGLLAAGGNSVALELILSSASELLASAEAAAQKLFPNQPTDTISTGLSGSILSEPSVADALRSRTRLPLAVVTGTPIEGVRRLLLRLEN